MTLKEVYLLEKSTTETNLRVKGYGKSLLQIDRNFQNKTPVKNKRKKEESFSLSFLSSKLIRLPLCLRTKNTLQRSRKVVVLPSKELLQYADKFRWPCGQSPDPQTCHEQEISLFRTI